MKRTTCEFCSRSITEEYYKRHKLKYCKKNPNSIKMQEYKENINTVISVYSEKINEKKERCDFHAMIVIKRKV
jgi:uncharacterized protein (UPF0371 family)